MIDQFSKAEFEQYLEQHTPYQALGLVQGEETYRLSLDNQSGIIIRSSVDVSGLSASVGQNSIRCWLVHNNDKPLGSKISKWITREPGWQNRLNEKIKQLLIWRTLAGDCPACDKPKGIFKVKKNNQNKGRPFARCTCTEHNNFVWLDEPIKTSSIYFSKGSGHEIYQDESVNSTLAVLAQDPEQQQNNSLQCADTNTQHNDTQSQEPETMSKVPNAAQLQAIEEDIKANVRVLAGPGSGKTFVIEHRYAHLVKAGINPEKILVCTFSKAMADEMGKRIQQTCPEAILEQISTIHAFCYRLLTRWYADSPFYRWNVPKDWKVKKFLEETIGIIWKDNEKPNTKEVLDYINSSKYFGLSTDNSYDYFVDTLGARFGGWLYEIRCRFDAWLKRNKWLTFADMLFETEQRIKHDPHFVAQLQQRFSHVIVDEAQDTNYQAMRILITISQSLDNSFFVVGDPDQMLYRFQGAKPELLTDELDDWLDNIETVKLEINYRSKDPIIDKSKELIANNYSAQGGPYLQEFMKAYSGIRGDGPSIAYNLYEVALEEATATTDQINELINGQDYSAGDFFVGARTRAQLGYLEGALVKAKIPFINICGGSFWTSRHVQDVIAYLRLAHDTSNKEALERVYNIPSAGHQYTWDDKGGKFKAGDYCPTRYLGKEFLTKIDHNFNNIDRILFGRDGWRYQTRQRDYNLYGPSKAEDLQEFVWSLQAALVDLKKSGLGVGRIIRIIIEDCYKKYLTYQGADDEGMADAKLDDLATVEDLADEFVSVDDFLAHIDEMTTAAEHAKDKDWDDYLVLSTYHRLKGLERRVVFGLGWCEGVNVKTGQPAGLLPHTFSLVPPPQFGVLPAAGQSPVEDERCIGFVCISRAKERVFLSGIRHYRTYEMSPSRFISEIGL